MGRLQLIALAPAGGTFGQQSQMLAQPLDILIGTPQKLMQHAEKGNLYWGDVQYVVLDEADTMFDKGFGPEVRAVLGPLRSKAEPAKAVLVVATLSKVCSWYILHGPYAVMIERSHDGEATCAPNRLVFHAFASCSMSKRFCLPHFMDPSLCECPSGFVQGKVCTKGDINHVHAIHAQKLST